MYTQKISIDIKTNIDKNEIVDEFGLLMSYYRGSGQTQGRIESQYVENNNIVCLPFTIEKDALNKKYNNFYVNRQIKKIEVLCNSRLKFRTIGKSYDTYENGCNCKDSGFYILATNYLTIGSPIICGTCNNSVPLYNLPVYHDYGYMPILSWESNYQAADHLQMNCEVGERWALNQMQNHTSQLSRQGLEICKKIENLTKTPVFYYLHNYKKYKGDQLQRPCPSCNSKWDLKEQLHDTYDFKCDKCGLISTLSPNT